MFLLSAIGALLAVLTSRLGRVIDRARLLGSKRTAEEPQAAPLLHAELTTLSQRTILVHRAITLSTAAAVLVCSVIVVLFVGAFLRVDFSVLVALLFIAAMGVPEGSPHPDAELFLATSSLRFGSRGPAPSLHPRRPPDRLSSDRVPAFTARATEETWRSHSG